jgi:hypothetical protein
MKERFELAPRRKSSYRRRLCHAVIVAAGLLSAPVPGFAQSESELALARKWFKEGEAAEKKNDCAMALDRFEKALAVKPTPQILIRIGTCQEKLGKLVEAAVSYDRALDKANAASLGDVASVAKEQADALRPRVPTITIALAEAYHDVSITLDGVALNSAVVGDKLPLNPGQHKLVAKAPGRRSFDQGFAVAESESRRVPIVLEEDGSAREAAKNDATVGVLSVPDKPATSSPSKVPAIALVAGGVAALGVGVVLFVVAAGKDSEVDDACGGSDRQTCPASRQEEIEGDVSTVNTLRAASFIVGGVGIASAAIGTGLLVTSSKRAASARGIELAPIAAPSRAGVRLKGHF